MNNLENDLNNAFDEGFEHGKLYVVAQLEQYIENVINCSDKFTPRSLNEFIEIVEGLNGYKNL